MQIDGEYFKVVNPDYIEIGLSDLFGGSIRVLKNVENEWNIILFIIIFNLLNIIRYKQVCHQITTNNKFKLKYKKIVVIWMNFHQMRNLKKKRFKEV